jgi:quercetin dioxygenase-like cupin family protein
MNGSFTSRDFAIIADRLSDDIPDRLLHPGVLKSGSDQDVGFSERRGHRVHVVDLPSRVLSMTLGGLEPGESTRKHRHNYETIIYVLEGNGMSEIGSRTVEWSAGDAFYVPVWAWHKHTNTSDLMRVRYVACENAPMLQNLGIALRQEA